MVVGTVRAYASRERRPRAAAAGRRPRRAAGGPPRPPEYRYAYPLAVGRVRVRGVSALGAPTVTQRSRKLPRVA